MDEKQLIAFRMRYAGRTSGDIAKATGYTVSTVATYFTSGGAWRETYDLWANRESEMAQERVRKALEGVLEIAGSILVDSLMRAKQTINGCKEKLDKAIIEGDAKEIASAEGEMRAAENRATDLAERVMDRAGMTIVNRTKLETKKPIESYDEVMADLIAAGIDPASIKYKSPAPERREGTLPE